MKDLRFYSGDGNAVNVTYRTSALQNSGNFTVMQVSGLNISTPGHVDNRALFAAFKRLPYNFVDFIAFAQQYNLFLSSADANGSNLTVLVTGTDSIGS